MIGRIVLAALVAGGLNATAATPANAQLASVANGLLCSWLTYEDPRAADGQTLVGEMDAGPLVAADPGATISVTCSIQLGGANWSHAGADTVVLSSGPGTPGVAAIPPTPISFSWEGQYQPPIFTCTQVTVDGVAYYWDAYDWDGDGWSTDSGVACAELICPQNSCGPPPPFQPVFEAVDALLGPALDPVLCPVLGVLAPGAPGLPGVLTVTGEGDVAVARLWVWDCPAG